MWNLMEVIGCVSIVLVVFFFTRTIWRIAYEAKIAKLLGRTLDLRNLGSWAVVTGATDGIGKSYVEELASRGINVVLISRSFPKLEQVATEIETKHGVKTKKIEADFIQENIYDDIKQVLDGLDIGILVNNVGMSYEYPEFMTNIPNVQDFAMSLIRCNIVSMVQMTLLILPRMTYKKKGLILNVSSVTAILPFPLITLYSSTKAFVYKFTRDLELEYRHCGVTIQCCTPGPVATKMSRIKKPSIKYPSPQVFVKEQLNSLGLTPSSCGYWYHALQVAFFQVTIFLNESFAEKFALEVVTNTRKRALQKRARLHSESNGEEVVNQ